MTTAGAVQRSEASTLTVQEALAEMQQAVRKGRLQEAAAIGAAATVPLSIPIESLSLLGEIASGAEATVLYGTLANTDVAVKRFKMHHSDDLKRFRRELSILASLDRHPNIVPLLGARALPPDYLLIMPLASMTLHNKLYQLGWRPNHVELLQLAVQAAEGLAAVHAKGIVHRDIKPSNMLMSDEGQLWLSDFGLAASVDEVIEESTLSINMVRSRGKPTGGFLKKAMAGTLEYMAPEVLQKQPASQASDMYALAVAINELATGVYPFSDCTKANPEIHTVLEHGYGRQELAAAVAAEGLRPTLPKAGPAGLTELLQAAWSLEPAARPNARQLRDRLAQLLQQAQAHQQAQQQQQKIQDCPAVAASRCCDSLSEDASAAAMDVEESASFDSTAPAAAAMRRQQQHYDSSSSSPGSSTSDVFVQDSSTLASSTLSLLPPYTPGCLNPGSVHSKTSLRRMPRNSSISALSAEMTVTDCSTGFNSSAGLGLGITARPLSTEASANTAAAAAAVPAALAVQGALSRTAAAAASNGAAAAAEAGAFGALGPREAMEDRHVLVRGLGGDTRVTLAAVFDGHRGCEAAAYAAAQLPRNLLLASVRAVTAVENAERQQQDGRVGSTTSCSAEQAVQCTASEQPAEDSSSSTAMALKQSFLATDAGFWQEWQAEMSAHASVGQYNERFPGCTALAAVVAGTQLYVANAGDGRAVLSRHGSAVPLSRQHTADLVDERDRVLQAGGTVAYRGGSWRVGAAALQVTRALGDFDLKVPAQQQAMQQRYSPCQNLGHNTPVTAEPEVVSLQLLPSDQFLILGTDGLWDVITDQEAVGLVHDTVKDPFLCAKRLVQEALSRGSTDNVSAVVLFLQPKDTLERVWKRGEGLAVPDVTPTFYGSRRMTTQQLVEQVGGTQGVAPAGVADELTDTY